VLVLNTRLVDLDTFDSKDALLDCQEAGGRRRIGEEEPMKNLAEVSAGYDWMNTHQNKTDVTSVISPVIIISLWASDQRRKGIA
jgi:hypothetical protein